MTGAKWTILVETTGADGATERIEIAALERDLSSRLWCNLGDCLSSLVSMAEGATMAGFLDLDKLFEARHFDREVIVLCVRWYLRIKLSYRDLVEMMAERGLLMAHTTIMRWVHRYAPEFERRWNRFARPVGSSWRVDETYVKIQGRWVYLDRAVDRNGKTVHFRLSARRDVVAAKAFFRKAIKSQASTPRTITLDGYAASHRAVREMKADGHASDTKLRSSKYLTDVFDKTFLAWCLCYFLLARVTAWPRVGIRMQARHAA